MIIDGHTDVLYALFRQQREFHVESVLGHVDLPRLKKGGVVAAFFAIFPAWSDYDIARGVDAWFNLVENSVNSLIHIKKFEDIAKCKKEDKVGAILHFEGSGGIDEDFYKLRSFHRLGLRSMGLSWSNVNKFATGVGTGETERGLTYLGKELVSEMERLGVIVDVSHLNEKSFWDVVDVAKKPFIASHSNSFTINEHERNLKDDQILAIGQTNGTIGINFCDLFLSTKLKNEDIGLDIIKNHIDKIVELSGIDNVSLGSDYDGASVPKIMKDVSYYPLLITYLEENGYSTQELEKITHKNFLRIMKECW
ncbi:MAG: dipeptidase [Candidatus Heimdallarchaeaceae archaeon]